ncbi:MAG: thiol-disulfide isomerase/thioredoxin [Glaciecola sp.]|jgi:thiol-disulfide isomerase/thioredoxin
MFLPLIVACFINSLSPSVPVEQLQVPAHTAYHDDSTAEGEPLALWFGRLQQAGEVVCTVTMQIPEGAQQRLQLKVGDTRRTVVQSASGLQVVDFGSFPIAKEGYQRFELTRPGDSRSKNSPKLVSLNISGTAATGAHFNMKPRKNAASVHLAYPLDQGNGLGDLGEVEAFYCEVTAEEDPLWTYYMATGWHRGYFGMQVNSPTERRIIFSVWDSGGEAVDRDKVADPDRVKLVDRGSNVVTGSFGNEGTGGHSHLVFDWKTGEKQRFLVTAKADDKTHTTFAGYYFRPDTLKWMLISSWRAPKEGRLLRGLYSFSENFGGRNGHVLRRASFANQWVRTKEGQWVEITRASFSHDATGKADRLDRYMGINDNEFFLSHGGFIEGEGKYGEEFDRKANGVLPDVETDPSIGCWRAVFESPGGELPFELEFSKTSAKPGSGKEASYSVLIRNGVEYIRGSKVVLVDGQVTIEVEPYDSRIIAKVTPDGRGLIGHWEKSAGAGKVGRMPFRARAGTAHRFPYETRWDSTGRSRLPADEQAAREMTGRWRVQFDSDKHHSVGIFTADAKGTASGTFLTTLGDYRYLEGTFQDGRLQLSCFDGGHAFLFDATLDDKGELQGDFWSRDSWHEKWTAVKDAKAELPDSFGLTTWDEGATLGQFSYPDKTGTMRALDDPAFAGKARLITLFGTWCPNCNDEAVFLAELIDRYGDRGLSILGIAFELEDNLERSVQLVERFQTRHKAEWPVLFGSIADKKVASSTISGLDKVRSYPTVLFVDKDNRVRAVHTGFAGPAAGTAHERMRDRYESLIEQLLAEE